MPGRRLVAAREPDQRVIAMAAHGEFDRIGDHFARHQRGTHALMAHGDAVGDGDGAEFAGRAARLLDALAWPTGPGASARCCRAPLRSSSSPRPRRAGGFPPPSAPWRNNRSDAARGSGPSVTWREGSLDLSNFGHGAFPEEKAADYGHGCLPGSSRFPRPCTARAKKKPRKLLPGRFLRTSIDQR